MLGDTAATDKKSKSYKTMPIVEDLEEEKISLPREARRSESPLDDLDFPDVPVSALRQMSCEQPTLNTNRNSAPLE